MNGIKRAMATITAADIPTLSLLYQSKKLVPATTADSTTSEAPASYLPSQSFNDRVGVTRVDITKLEVDAIVNAANSSLRGGGGVDGSIHWAAGNGLMKECLTLGGCDTGSAKITKGYQLPCKKIIHAVGPIYHPSTKEESAQLLAGCYSTSLQLAVENNCKSIVFSCLSTGVYGYPSRDAASVAIRTVRKFLEGEHGDKLDKVAFCTFVEKDVMAYEYWLPRIFPPVETEVESDWEEVEGGSSAENGPATSK